MMRATAMALFALLLLSSCSKTATTATSAAAGATSVPAFKNTNAPIVRTATAAPQSNKAKTLPSPTVRTSSANPGSAPQTLTPAMKASLPAAKPSPKQPQQQAAVVRASPTAKTTAAGLTTKTAAPRSTVAPTVPPTPAVVAVVGNIANGRQLYEQHCANCHGADAQGGMGPSLQNEDARKNLAQTVSWIEHPALPMPNLYPGTLSKKDVLDIATYVQSLK